MTTIAVAVLAGMGVLLAGSLPWGAFLAPLNLRLLPVVPWAIVPMAISCITRSGRGDSRAVPGAPTPHIE